MSEPVLQLNEFFVEGGDQLASHVLLHITEPSTPAEKAKGYFFAICEINHGTAPYLAKVQSLIDEIENNYYELDDQTDKNSLELILEKINQGSATFLLPTIELNCLVGAIRQPEIIFSTVGRPLLWLLYKNRHGLYQRLNLLEQNETGAETDTPQLFSHIVQGKISPHDYVVAGSPHIADYFDGDRLQKLTTSRPVKQTATHLERVLAEIKNGYSFGGLIIHSDAPTPEAAAKRKGRPTQTVGSANSLTGFFATEQQTARTLAPTMLGRLQQKLSEIPQKLKSTSSPTNSKTLIPTNQHPDPKIEAAHAIPRRARDRAPQPPAFVKQSLTSGVKLILQALSKVGQGLITVAALLWSGLIQLLRGLALLAVVIFNYHNRRRLIMDEWRRSWYRRRDYVRYLPRTTKIILVVSILVILLLIISAILISRSQKRRAAETAFNSNLQAITTALEAAESALIYHNEPGALTELNAAEQIFTTLPCAVKTFASRCAEPRAALERLRRQARKITIVSPQLLARWDDNVTKILRINNLIVGASPTSSRLSLFDLLSRETKTIPLPTTLQPITATDLAAPKENDYALLLYNDRSLVSFDPKNLSLKTSDISYPSDQIKVTAIAVYNRRLYSLDAAGAQLYKHDAIKTGFGPGKEWLREPNSDLSSGIDLTIDGDILILKTDGTIIKFANGTGTPLNTQGLDPKLQGGGEIWSYNDFAYLYVLDPSNQRLVVLEKDGQVVRQITADEFNNPTGMIIDEVNNTGYIVDSGKLFKIGLK